MRYQKHQDAADHRHPIVGHCTQARGIIAFAAAKLYQAKVRFVPRRVPSLGLARVCDRKRPRADRLLGGVISLDARTGRGEREGGGRGGGDGGGPKPRAARGNRGCAIEGFVSEPEPRGHHFQRNRERARAGTRGSPDPAAIPIASLFDMRQFRPICRAP